MFRVWIAFERALETRGVNGFPRFERGLKMREIRYFTLRVNCLVTWTRVGGQQAKHRWNGKGGRVKIKERIWKGGRKEGKEKSKNRPRLLHARGGKKLKEKDRNRCYRCTCALRCARMRATWQNLYYTVWSSYSMVYLKKGKKRKKTVILYYHSW